MAGVLGHYRLVCELGRGGMGEVYLAEDIELGHQLVLKIAELRAALASADNERGDG